ncbi:hypothetical protein [Paeniclostridium hominis]|uniref:hypothetical protein n=1 Tax=Paeniclostridium hominis TaxID=2764329 RepID=UPI0022E0B17D|nr:hypothetical protein [Paeniclostridium hominis]
MVLTSPIAKDKELIINKGLDYYDPSEQIADIQFFVKRKRMTVEEGEYLKNKIEQQILERDQATLRK